MKNPKVPKPFNQWINYKEWQLIPKDQRKILTDLTRLQRRLRKHFKNYQPESYVNMNAEIEYDRMNGLR